jgi:hypothetical protein
MARLSVIGFFDIRRCEHHVVIDLVSVAHSDLADLLLTEPSFMLRQHEIHCRAMRSAKKCIESLSCG